MFFKHNTQNSMELFLIKHNNVINYESTDGKLGVQASLSEFSFLLTSTMHYGLQAPPLKNTHYKYKCMHTIINNLK